MNNVARIAGGALLIWVALGTPGMPTGGGLVPSAPYSGSMSALHSAAGSMDAKDRQGLSEVMAATAAMVKDDRTQMIKTTEDVQKMIRGAMSFGYSTFSSSKYPAVASAVQSELERVVGSTIEPLDSGKRAAVVAALEEMARAIK